MFNNINELASAVAVRNYLRSMQDNSLNTFSREKFRKIEDDIKKLEINIFSSFEKLMNEEKNNISKTILPTSGEINVTFPTPIETAIKTNPCYEVYDPNNVSKMSSNDVQLLKTELKKMITPVPEIKKERKQYTRKSGSFKKVED